MSSNLIAEKERYSVTVRISRPEKRNPLDLGTVNDLIDIISESTRDKSVRAVIITGSGDKSFASGVDLKEMAEIVTSAETALQYDGKIGALYRSIQNAQIPIIAKVQSSALGGGGLLAAACDFCVASQNAKFGLPAGRLGIMLSPSELQIALTKMTVSRAKFLTTTGHLISADEAYQWGIFDMVVEDGSLDSTVDKIIEEIAQCGPEAVTVSKMLLSALSDGADALISQELVGRCYEKIYNSDDFKEGMTAFLERRRPNYKGS